MADIEDRDRELVPQPLDEGQQLALAGRIERGERLVHQQELRRGEQRPADGDPLPLAAGERGRPPVEQMTDPEHGDDGVERQPPVGLGREETAVGEVGAHREMRQQQRVLEHDADAPPVRRPVDARLGVGQRLAIEADPPAIRPLEPRDQAQSRRFAGSRGAEERGDARPRLEGGVEGEAWPRQAAVEADHAALARAARRASSSDTSNAPSAMMTATSESRSAPASPPGACV